jgi:hypothetical protein
MAVRDPGRGERHGRRADQAPSDPREDPRCFGGRTDAVLRSRARRRRRPQRRERGGSRWQ